MLFIDKILSNYEIVSSVRIPDYSDSFELDNDVMSFLQEYNLWDDVEAVATAKILSDKERAKKSYPAPSKKSAPVTPDVFKIAPNKAKNFARYPLETELRLTKKMQASLTRTYKIFVEGKEAEKRWKRTTEGLTKEVQDLIKKVAVKLKVEPRGIRVEVDFESGTRYVPEGTAGHIELHYKGKSIKLEPEGLYYRADEGGNLGDAMGSWNWAAWLGDDRSPFHSGTWTEAYAEDQTSQWFEQAGSLEGDADQIENKIKDLLLEHAMGDQKDARPKKTQRAGTR